MTRRVFSILALLIPILTLTFLGSCGGEEQAIPTGKIIVGVTDRPDENISSIAVTTDLIEASISTAAGEDDKSSWQVLLDGDNTFDLIEVAGVEDVIGESDIPAATYNQVRMHVTSVMVTLNGQEVEASVPSGIIKLVTLKK